MTTLEVIVDGRNIELDQDDSELLATNPDTNPALLAQRLKQVAQWGREAGQQLVRIRRYIEDHKRASADKRYLRAEDITRLREILNTQHAVARTYKTLIYNSWAALAALRDYVQDSKPVEQLLAITRIRDRCVENTFQRTLLYSCEIDHL